MNYDAGSANYAHSPQNGVSPNNVGSPSYGGSTNYRGSPNKARSPNDEPYVNSPRSAQVDLKQRATYVDKNLSERTSDSLMLPDQITLLDRSKYVLLPTFHQRKYEITTQHGSQRTSLSQNQRRGGTMNRKRFATTLSLELLSSRTKN